MMNISRRGFMQGASIASLAAPVGASAVAQVAAAGSVPWYQKVHRWGQTNISLNDVAIYDVQFWREQLRRTGIQAIMANGVAGFATFRSRNPLVDTSHFAPERDLFGEIAAGARADGMYLIARMDANVLNPRIVAAYPDWRNQLANGVRYDLMCINSPYRETHVYPIYREMIYRYNVDAFTDNAGVSGGPLCYCSFCKEKFAKEVGGELPPKADLADPRYRAWRRWNAGVTMARWDEANAYTRKYGGKDCVYIGLVRKFASLNHEIAKRAGLLMMDCQSRNDAGSFHEHADDGRMLHSMIGWEKTVAVCTSMTQHSHGYFRLATDPAAECSLYTNAGLAGGFNPWWHHPTAYTADRRAFENAPPMFQSYVRDEPYFNDLRPVVQAGIAYSDANAEFFGRDAPGLYQPGQISDVAQVPFRGMSHALSAAGVAYMPFHLSDLDRHAGDLPMIVLPNVGGLSDAECAAIKRYVAAGGGLLATGATSLFDDDGEPRKAFALADVLGVDLKGSLPARDSFQVKDTETYLAIDPDAAQALGGHGAMPELVPYGGIVLPVNPREGRRVLAVANEADGTAGLPAVITGQYGRGRVVYMPVDVERRFYHAGLLPQARLLGVLARWASGKVDPLAIDAPQGVGGYLYRWKKGLVLHVFNGSGHDNGNELASQVFPAGPVRIKVAATADLTGRARQLVNPGPVRAASKDGMIEVVLDRVDQMQTIVFE